MPDSDKKIKHFVLSRFFPMQRDTYPYSVLDTDFLSTQFPLAKNILRSLENQTNKNFEFLFMLNNNFFDNPKYEFIFSTLRESTTLPVDFIKPNNIFNLVKAAYDDYDFVITTQMDFDDFIFKDAVEDTQSKVDECNDVMAYGYNRGYVYIYGELYSHFTGNMWGRQGHPAIFQSLILKSSFAKKLPLVFVGNFHHNHFKSELKSFLEKNDVEFVESMFQQNVLSNAYIYFRHEFSQEKLAGLGGRPFDIPKKPPLTTKDITKK